MLVSIHRDEQQVVLILQSGVIKAMQKKKLQLDDVIKRPPVKNEYSVLFDSCINLRKVSPLRSTQI